MKFQLDEVVEHPDTDLVLRTLEHYFRDVSLQAVRTGDQIVVYGLGPSFRTMNHNDRTIVLATSRRPVTVIHTEANFMPSAFMGDAPQDDVVRSKIERVFESLRVQLNSETAAPIDAERISLPPINRPRDFSSPSSAQQKTEVKTDEPALAGSLRPVTVSSAAIMQAGPTKKRQYTILLLLALLILLFLGAGYFLQHRYQSFSSKSAEQAASSAAVNNTTAPLLSPPARRGQFVPTEMPREIRPWVEAWAAAMRTRSAQAQVSFYANPVDRYFRKPDVGREQLLKDKQSEIKSRNGLWTFKAEDIHVLEETPSTAAVQLIKHVIVELPSSAIREQHIKTRLKLRLIDGNWKITAEQTLY